MSPPDVAMCWDGVTETAELRINGRHFVGKPHDVEAAFDALNELKDEALDARARCADVRNALMNAMRRLP